VSSRKAAEYLWLEGRPIARIDMKNLCTSDYDMDGDIDGRDIAASISGSTDISSMAAYFGKTTCPEQVASVYYYHTDHLGAPQAVTDNSGGIVWKADYLPFGKVIVSPLSTIENNLRFPGQYYDMETGLHYNWHRYYDPETGRYLTPDPIGLDGGMNLYVYVRNGPVNFVDPEGLYRDIGGGFGITLGIVSFAYTITTDTCCDENANKHLRTLQVWSGGWEIGLGLNGSGGSNASISDDKTVIKKCPNNFDASGYYSDDSGVWGALIVGRSYSKHDGTGWKFGIGGGWSIWSGNRIDILNDVVVGKCCDVH